MLQLWRCNPISWLPYIVAVCSANQLSYHLIGALPASVARQAGRALLLLPSEFKISTPDCRPHAILGWPSHLINIHQPTQSASCCRHETGKKQSRKCCSVVYTRTRPCVSGGRHQRELGTRNGIPVSSSPHPAFTSFERRWQQRKLLVTLPVQHTTANEYWSI